MQLTKHMLDAVWMLSVLLLATWRPMLSSAAPMLTCGRVAVYVTNSSSSSSSHHPSLQYDVATEWGNYPGEVKTQPLCNQSSPVLQSIKPAQFGSCLDVRGTAAVAAVVTAAVQAAWPQLRIPRGQDCWCATEGTYSYPSVLYMPYVHLRVRRIGVGEPAEGGAGARKLLRTVPARNVLSDQAVRAINMPPPIAAEDDVQAIQCQGDAALYAANDVVTVVNGWYRVVRNESICHASDAGDTLAIMFRLTEKC